MPLYNYHCENCGLDLEKFNTVENREYMACNCGYPMTKIMSAISKPIILEYYNEGLGAVVTGPRQRQRLMKAKGLTEAA